MTQKKIKRTVRVVPAKGTVGHQVDVAIEVVAPDDVATGFTLQFPTDRLRLLGVRLGDAATAAGAALTINNLHAEPEGKVFMMLDAASAISDGTAFIVCFQALKAGRAKLDFTDLTPSQGKRSMSDAMANTVPATFKGGTVTISK